MVARILMHQVRFSTDLKYVRMEWNGIYAQGLPTGEERPRELNVRTCMQVGRCCLNS